MLTVRVKMKIKGIMLAIMVIMFSSDGYSADIKKSSSVIGCCMKVEINHHIDASEPDDKGLYDYYYEFDMYRFSIEQHTFIARSYTDEPQEIHFLGIETKGKKRMLRISDFQTIQFRDIKKYLENKGKVKITWLSGEGNGYSTVP